MGVISDSFKARLDEMRERHAQTDREIAVHRARCNELLEQMQAISEDMEDLASDREL